MKRIVLALAALCLIATGANSYWQSRVQVSVGSAPVGPPTFTEQPSIQSFTGSFPNYSATVSIGTASSNTLVCSMFYALTNGTFTAADFNGVSATLTMVGSDGPSNTKWAIACGNVTTGTSATLNVTSTDSFFGTAIATWTADQTQFVSTTPVVALNSSPTSPVTTTINVLAGGAVLAMGIPNGGTGISPSFTTPNTIGITTDESATFTVAGTKNNSSALTPGSASATSGGTPDNYVLGLAAFR